MTRTPLLAANQPIDVDKLLVSHLLAQANSGGGKSFLVRRLLEETYGLVQHIVIDVEGEFHTLRERFDYVLANQRGGDTLADCKTAPLLARRFLELGVSAIVDIYELGVRKAEFIKIFVEALVNAPREMWRPVLIVIDEAHLFCPESGHAESGIAIRDLMTRGRKRGYGVVLATQRIASLAKSAVAEVNNKLIGRTSLDIDRKRAGAELGFTTKDELMSLRKLKPGEFFAFGPAIVDDVTLIKIGPVLTSHPDPSQRSSYKPTPPREKIQKLLPKFADLPAEAAEEARTLGEMKVKIKQLEHALREQAKAAPKPQPIVERVVEIEKPVITEGQLTRLEKLAGAIAPFMTAFATVRADRDIAAVRALKVTTQIAKPANGTPARPTFHEKTTPTRYERNQPDADGAGISVPEMKLLGSLAWWASVGVSQPELAPFAFIAGYTVNGTFHNLRGKLRSGGFIEYLSGQRTTISAKGQEFAPATPEWSLETLHAKVMERLDNPPRKLLLPLLERYPETMTNDELAEAAGYTVNGTFHNLRGHLRSVGIIEYEGGGRSRACAWLFPEGL
jgi:hypothetical protein